MRRNRKWLALWMVLLLGVSLFASFGSTHAEDSSSEESTDDGKNVVRLLLDNENTYEGMDKPYESGYMPSVANNEATIVLPVLCDGKLKDDELRFSIDLGSAEQSPFVFKNYDKNVSLVQQPVKNSTELISAYLCSLNLELKQDRYNDSYPVTITANGVDEKGIEITEQFTLFVTISDGKNPNEEPQPEPQPVVADIPEFAPKLMIQNVTCDKTPILAGDFFTLTVTLLNTAKDKNIKNLMVNSSSNSEYITMQNALNAVYVDSVAANATCELKVECQVSPKAPVGQYGVSLELGYDDAKGSSYTVAQEIKVTVKQQTKVQFDMPVIPMSVEVADLFDVTVQAMNLGRSKIYNVRAVLEAEGLTPDGTIFIGDIEPGTMMRASTQVSVGGLYGGDSSYGTTSGTITYYYEDEDGVEFTEQQEFSTEITSPFYDTNITQEKKDQPSQWWIIMAGIVFLIIVTTSILLLIQNKKKGEVSD